MVAVVVALALAAALFGIMRTVGVDDTAESSGRTDTKTSTPSPTVTTEPTAADDQQALESCRALWSVQQDVLDAARPAMRQWDTHIAAMNQLVAGTITLDQATAFWNRTRVGASRNLAAFVTADTRFRSASDSLCPEAAAPPAGASSGLQACLDAVEAGRTTVDAARTTMTTWRHHVHDMERLRAGTLSPAVAQRLWIKTWKQGDRELRTYERHDRAAEQLSCVA